uniref:Peptidase S54 rhomboid domain-containing protein n=1 Tax=Dunaliella tertiolecta TaxID=3047 RepID=A0A7S3VU54_DUNTE|mmetsp:Transcript_20094/g.55933  ORF Transcript_20094/g.55933 Transcript_20094/m.55933 type:complete len:442 (+) Transcript_20094:31-1356(+)
MLQNTTTHFAPRFVRTGQKCIYRGGVQKPTQARTSATKKDDEDTTLSNLESILGSDEGPRPKEDEELVEWWRIRPRQSAPPRTKTMAPGPSGRFVMSEDFMGELRVGRKTELGSQLEIPKVQPVLSYVFCLMNFSCAGTFMNVQAFQGPEIGREYLMGICNSSVRLAEAGLLHPLLSCFQAPGPLELGVALWALAVVGPQCEACVGGFTFAFIYMLAGYSGALAALLLQQAALFSGSPIVNAADASCGASASLLGIIACLAVYHARNAQLEAIPNSEASASQFGSSANDSNESSNGSSSSQSASNSSSSSSSSSSASGNAAPQQQQQQVLFINAVGVVVASFALAVFHREGPYEGVVPLSLLPTVVGGVIGALIANGMCPRYYVQQEAQIPDGAMFIPENIREMAMLLDRTTGLQRGVVAVSSSVVLLGAAQALNWVQGWH